MDVTNDRTEQLVRQTLAAVADQVQSPEDANDDMRTDTRSVPSRPSVTALRRTRRRNRRLVIIAACLVVVLVAGGVALLTQRAENSPNVSISPVAIQPPDSDTSLPYAIPGNVDEITSLVPLPTIFQQFYEGTYAGASAQLTVAVEVFPDVLKQGVGGSCAGPMPKVEVNGHDGCSFGVADSQGAVLKQVVSWVEDSNTSIDLESTTLSRDQLVELASNAKRDGSRIALDPVPDGLQASGSHIVPNADEQGVVHVNFTHNDCDYFLSRQVSTTLPTGSAPVTINGYPGTVTGDYTVSWVVRGSLISLNVGSISTGAQTPQHVGPEPAGPQPVAPSCDVQATAATIRYITAADWNQLVDDHSSDTTATTTMPPTTTTPTTTSSPGPDSSQPQYEGEEALIANVFQTWISGPDVETTIGLIEDGPNLRDTINAVRAADAAVGSYSGRVDAVQIIDDSHAFVTFSIFKSGSLTLSGQHGAAIKIDGTWHVSRATYCSTIGMGTVKCPSQ